jgi:hypothetical protein
LLYLHIGSHKTGTSSIQDSFFKSQSHLHSQGIDYFQYSANHSQPMLWRFGSKRFTHPVTVNARLSREDVLRVSNEVNQQLCNFITDTHFPTKVISGEEISTLSDGDISGIKSFLNDFDVQVRIIIYIRNYYEYLSSEIQELIKWGWTLPDLKKAIARGDVVQPNYKGRIQKFITHFGRSNVEVRVFHPDHLLRGDLLADFCQAIGSLDACEGLTRRTTNTSMSGSSVRLLSLYNEVVQERIGGSLNPGRAENLKKQIGIIEGDKFKLSDKQALELFETTIQADADYVQGLMGSHVSECLLARGRTDAKEVSEYDDLSSDHKNLMAVAVATALQLEDQRAVLSLALSLLTSSSRGPAEQASVESSLRSVRSDSLCREVCGSLLTIGRVRLAQIAAQRALEINPTDPKNIQLSEQVFKSVAAHTQQKLVADAQG